MKNQKYKAIVIGCGRIGALVGNVTHAHAYQNNPRVQLVGVVDADLETAKNAGKDFNTNYSNNSLEMCNQFQPEIISICTPDSTHASIAEEILSSQSPRIIFMEKPLGLSSKEAKQLIGLAKMKNCAIEVNYSRRYSPAFQQIRDELHSGKHGRPLWAQATYGKGLFHNGTHLIDLLRYWLGEPQSAKASGNTWGPDQDPSLSFDLEFASCSASVRAFDERIATVFEVDLFTEFSRFKLWLGGSQIQCFSVLEGSTVKGYKNYVPIERKDLLLPMQDCLANAVQNIVQVLDGSAELICPAQDALMTLEWAERISQSLS